ncbi:hypothetical protein [Paenibacillus campi]|uniref:hypothetical protein n=1 Tax=Paenibacillus campi TaxID=3106031 RepID=UPI002AFE4D44|nr:hypothetical protein [Paenibacillus sp. SGZ-1009]
MSQHVQFSVVNTKISFADFCRALYAPIYNEQGESEYYIELYHHSASEHTFRWFGFKNGESSYEPMRKRLLTGARSKYCMYYSVCPRDRQIQDKEDGRKIRTTRADITIATACWLDFDYKHFSSDICEADDMIIDKICSMDPFPSIIVKTPGGYHCYFLLDNKYPVEDICYTNRRMEKRWEADHCSDATRLMRIPMGKHFKEVGDGKPVTIIHFDDTLRYTLDDFDHYPAVSECRTG